MGLFKNEKVYDDSNYKELLGDGVSVDVCGDKRLLARLPPPMGADPNTFSTPFAASGIKTYPRSDWSAMLKEQKERKARVSDYCDFPAFDQNGLPTCWAICTAQAGTVQRRIQGLPLKKLSGCSIAVVISGGHSGGYEGEAIKLAASQGWASVEAWPENNTSRKYINDSAVAEDRKNHVALEWINVGDSFENWFAVCWNRMVGAFAYGWMSHCMMSCDIVEIEPGSFGFRPRNSWTDQYGAKNDLGFGGFNVWREGRGTPDSGFVLKQITASTN